MLGNRLNWLKVYVHLICILLTNNNEYPWFKELVRSVSLGLGIKRGIYYDNLSLYLVRNVMRI